MNELDFTGLREVWVREDHPGVETLEIPASVEAFYGLNRFPDLRTVTYHGTADIFGFAESLEWLSEKVGDDDLFVRRLFTDMLGARPISPALLAIIAPNMVPVQAMAGYHRLLAGIEEFIRRCNTRQDTSRQNGVLSRSFAQVRRLACAMELGRAVSGWDRPDYPAEERFTAEEQVIYALALVQGHSYQHFFTGEGFNGYEHMRTRADYIPFLRQLVALEDTETFRRQLEQLLDWGILTEHNRDAALELTLRAGLTEATAFLLARQGGSRQTLEEEFSL